MRLSRSRSGRRMSSLSGMRPNPYRRETSNPPGAGLGAHSRASPRHIKIERKDNGFGFTLRHFIVYPSEDGSDGGPPIQECENIVTFVFEFSISTIGIHFITK